MSCACDHHNCGKMRNACRLSACTPRDRRSAGAVCQRRHWCCACCPACCCTRRSNFSCCEAVVHRTCSHSFSRSHNLRMFCCIGGIVFTQRAGLVCQRSAPHSLLDSILGAMARLDLRGLNDFLDNIQLWDLNCLFRDIRLWTMLDLHNKAINHPVYTLQL